MAIIHPAAVEEVRRPVKSCDGFILMGGVALLLLGCWTMLAAIVGACQWFAATEEYDLLVVVLGALQKLAVILYENYNMWKVFSGMLGIWLSTAIVEGIVTAAA
jgi:hypothetical protein